MLDGAFFLAAAKGEGGEVVRLALAELVDTQRAGPQPERQPSAATEQEATHRVYRHQRRDLPEPVVTRESGGYRVTSAVVERLVSMTDLDSEEAVVMLQRRMRTAGVDAMLAAAGCREGDTVYIGAAEFEWQEG